MQTRHQIGMAQGMLRLRYGLSEEQAFQFLVRTSSHSNMKLPQVAVRVTDELAGPAGRALRRRTADQSG
jgi:AmiR/NasT family two-component response regulator